MGGLKIQFYYGKDSGHFPDYNEINLRELEHGRFIWTSPTAIFIVGSCNGLVCLEESHKCKSIRTRQVISICNPLTGEIVRLPGSRKLNLSKEDSVVGFGYLPSTNEYKIVRIHYTMFKEGRVEVYTLGSKLGWRDAGKIPFSLPLRGVFAKRARNPFFLPLSGVFANGAVHWLVEQGGVEYKVVAFDFENEKFKMVPSPPFDGYVQPRLFLLGEDLCLVLKNLSCDCIDIWVFKKKMSNGSTTCEAKQNQHEHYNDHQQEFYYDNTWRSKEYFDIPFCRAMDHEPMAITNENEVLLLCRKRLPREICCYNRNTLALATVGKSEYFRPVPHMNSFVSLKALGECSRFHGLFRFVESGFKKLSQSKSILTTFDIDIESARRMHHFTMKA